ELAGSFEPNFMKDGRLQVKARGSVIHEAFNKGKGWYSEELIQPVNGKVTPSQRNYEPYAGFEAFLSPESGSGFGPAVSVDIRDRTVYGYARSSRSVPENTQLSFNTLVGFRQLMP